MHTPAGKGQWFLLFHHLESLFRRDEQMQTEEGLLKTDFWKNVCTFFLTP